MIETHNDEFKEQAKMVAKDAEALMTTMKILLRKSGTVKKADREAMINQAEKVVREMSANMPYMENCFAKSMDKVVTDAKGTIEAFYQHRVIETGLAAINDQQVKPPTLIENK